MKPYCFENHSISRKIAARPSFCLLLLCPFLICRKTVQGITIIEVNGRKIKNVMRLNIKRCTKHEWTGKWVKFSFSFSHRMLANLFFKSQQIEHLCCKLITIKPFKISMDYSGFYKKKISLIKKRFFLILFLAALPFNSIKFHTLKTDDEKCIYFLMHTINEMQKKKK